jgi:hypothetical protein
MESIDWTATGAIWTAVGALISGVGLVGIAVSILLARKSYTTAVIGQLYGELHHIHHTFIEHSDMRPYFFHGKFIGSKDDDYMKARSIAEMYLDIFEQIFILRPLAPRKLRPFFEAYIRDMLSESPLLREYLVENEKLLYPQQLVDIVRSACAQERELPRNEGGPTPNTPASADRKAPLSGR